jgi:hypothetical protein
MARSHKEAEMARFNPATYNPGDDSTDHYDTNPGELILVVDPGTCHCGCTTQLTNAKRNFRQGHDATLKGKLIRAHLTGTPVRVNDGDGKTQFHGPARDLATKYGWGYFLTNAEQRKDNQPRKAKPAAALHSIKIAGGKVVEAKVVNISGDKVTLEYTNAKGEAKQVTRTKASLRG